MLQTLKYLQIYVFENVELIPMVKILLILTISRIFLNANQFQAMSCITT